MQSFLFQGTSALPVPAISCQEQLSPQRRQLSNAHVNPPGVPIRDIAQHEEVKKKVIEMVGNFERPGGDQHRNTSNVEKCTKAQSENLLLALGFPATKENVEMVVTLMVHPERLIENARPRNT